MLVHDLAEDELYLHKEDSEDLDLGLLRASVDGDNPITAYARYLLQMGELHNLHILNEILCFLDSSKFTCFPHGGSASVVYLRISCLSSTTLCWPCCLEFHNSHYLSLSPSSSLSH